MTCPLRNLKEYEKEEGCSSLLIMWVFVSCVSVAQDFLTSIHLSYESSERLGILSLPYLVAGQKEDDELSIFTTISVVSIFFVSLWQKKYHMSILPCRQRTMSSSWTHNQKTHCRILQVLAAHDTMEEPNHHNVPIHNLNPTCSCSCHP